MDEDGLVEGAESEYREEAITMWEARKKSNAIIFISDIIHDE